MRSTIRSLALAAVLAGVTTGLAFAQDPISAAIGTAGAVAGTAVNTAGAVAGAAVGAAAGTAAAVVGAYPYGYNGPRCPRHYYYSHGACYLR
jgi:hypothetical protein